MTKVTKEQFDKRTKIFTDTFGSGCSLDKLISLMKKENEAALYLCGKLLDDTRPHGCYLVSDDLGFLFSTLPEDGTKAAKPGYHPGSTEIYVIFNGSLVIESLENGDFKEENLEKYYVKTIPPRVCHRVRKQPGKQAASFIIKTNLKYEPDVVRCDECTLHQVDTCPLYTNWVNEEDSKDKMDR